MARLEHLIDKPDQSAVDCAAYTLKVGPEYYVTPNDKALDPASVTLKKLDHGEAFAIPAGQFGYLLTEEIVSVPTDAIAFISIRARFKWKGIVNVSGFHVDPGFSGRLLFAVYNAGPVSVHFRRGDAAFLIWFADLDEGDEKFSKAGMPPTTTIDTASITQVAGEIYSVQGLAEKIRQTEKDLGKRITSLERANGVIKVLAGAIVAIAITFAGQWFVKNFTVETSQNTSAEQPHSPPPAPR